MKSAQLLAILEEIKNPSEIITKLNAANFAVTDKTEEGDSILHILAKSSHAENSLFANYLKLWMAAGANANALDKQGNNFLGYYLAHTKSYYVHGTFDLLLADKNFDINQTVEGVHTFFEFIYSSKNFNSKHAFETLIARKDFNPNQKTSKHNSMLLHMISENRLRYRDYINDVAKNIKLDPNIKNNNNQTALAQILSHTEYKDMNLIRTLINHEQCEINTLDKDGNNYLQLAIIFCKNQADEIASLVIEKGIDVAHRNNDGKSIFDLIIENKANRSVYTSKNLLIDILKLHPSSLLEKFSDGKSILFELLRSQDYTITSKFSTILELCKNQNNGPEFLKNTISDCFYDFSQKKISEETIQSLIQTVIDAKISIDVEYCLVLTAINIPSFQNKKIIENLRKLKPELDLNAILSHGKNLTKEHSKERSQALSQISKLGIHLNCLDESLTAQEGESFRPKTNPALGKDSKMFGHLFSLSGSIPVHGNPLTLTGSLSAQTAPFMVYLMNAFVAHCETTGTHIEHWDAIRQVRNMTVNAMRFYFGDAINATSIKPSKDDILASILEDSKNSGVEIITGWPGHAINLIIKQDDFYRNNGGGCSTDATTEHYKITKAENFTKNVITTLYTNMNKESNKIYIQRDLHKLLGLLFVNKIEGEFQTVGNCSLQSMLIALKIKYRLFLPEDKADNLFADTVKFFKQFYLGEYLSRYSDSPTLPPLLMRLIIQKLMHDEKLELAKQLLTHFGSEASQEIMQIEFMLKRWQLIVNDKSTEHFDRQLRVLGVELDPKMNTRLQILNRFLNDAVTTEDLDSLKSWTLEEQQLFQGYHLLHFAVANNNLFLASSLIQMFPKAINQTNWFDQEPLCLVKSVEMIDILVRAGASTASTDKDNALDHAIKANKSDLVDTLLQYGAKPSKHSAYYAAAKDPKILQSLIEFHPTTVKTPIHSLRTATHAAAISGRTDNLHTLVYYGGANPAEGDVNGITPLQLALKNENNDTAKLLIQYPGTLFKKTHRGDRVVEMTKNEDLKQLITLKKQERKADLNYFEAFKKSDPGIIEQDMDYLIIAIRKNDIRAIRGCLIAFPNIKVVDISKLYSTMPLAEAIQNLAGKKGREYKEAFEIVQMLLKTPGININAIMATSEPILFMATSIGDVSVLELFLADPKLDPNKQDNVGYTALHDAVERGHLDCVKRLLKDNRVDSTIVNHHGETASDLEGSKFNVSKCKDEVTKHQLHLELNRMSIAG